MGKKIIILDNGGGRFGNQIWNDAAIYAYALEKKYDFENWACFEYSKYFKFPKIKNFFIRTIFFNRLIINLENVFLKKWFVRVFLKKICYLFFSKVFRRIKKELIISAIDETFFFLPPSEPVTEYQKKIKNIELSPKTFYFCDNLFKNPVGMRKYRNEILQYFEIKEKYRIPALNFFNTIKSRYEYVVGVHFRQGDFKLAPTLIFSEKEIYEFLKSYLFFSKRKSEKTCFIICSDETFDKKIFKDINIVKGPGDEIEDFLVLSFTDIIIGSNSSYSAFAAYYGDISFVVFERDGINWEYYKDKKGYFENKLLRIN